MTETRGPLPVAGRPAGAPVTHRVPAPRRFFRVPPASERVAEWQVGPAVDMAAYHFSWVWMLVPLLALGDGYPMDYAPLLALALVLGFVHRHATLPGVYLDREVFSRHPLRFTLVPALLIAALLMSPRLIRDGIPAGLLYPGGWPGEAIPGSVAFGAVLFVAGTWNVWHVYMQKFGILRIYAAKAGAAPAPAWIDRGLVLGWVPLIVLHLGTGYADLALERFSAARTQLSPLIAGLAAWQELLWPLASGLAAASVMLFFSTEWNRQRWRNGPRLSMGIGTVGLSASFLIFDPIKVYIAFGFSHAVEYLVFVWAFERRRHHTPRPHRPLLGRILAWSSLAHPAFYLSLAALYLLTKSWAHYGFEIWSLPTWVIAGTQITVWMRLWAVYQSLQHFYYDGFLWKRREPGFHESI